MGKRKHKVKEMTLSEQNERLAMKVSVNSMAVNILLSVFKLFAGVAAHSGAMVSDAVHSASDVFSTIVVMIGIKISGKDSDEEHPYGHERFECVAAILLSVVLCITGVGIGITGVRHIREGSVIAVPGLLAMIAAVVSIAVKEGMYWYTRIAAKKINSSALMADAWHHRSDALSSVGSLVGIAGARLGYPVCDSIASIVICVFIVKASYDIFKDSIDKMTDKAWNKEQVEAMRRVILEEDGVLGIDKLQTRLFGSKVYVDIEICADSSKSLTEAHGIAERVHDEIEKQFEDVKHCMVHVNPDSVQMCEQR